MQSENLSRFENDGYVIIRQAFSRETAFACRKLLCEELALEGIDIHNRITWKVKHGLSKTYMSTDGHPWSDVFTPLLKQSIDDICGVNRWKDFGCGWWMITFPEMLPPPWRVDGRWHIDGHWYQHYPFSPEVGLVPVMFFSDVYENGGGTAIAVGSHRAALKILLQAGLRGCTNTEIVSAMNPEDLEEIVELTGQAGDVALLHPLLVHARSINLGTAGANSIRFMCHPSVPLKEPLSFDLPVEDLTLLERSIVRNCGSGVRDLMSITPSAVAAFSEGRYAEETTCARKVRKVKMGAGDAESAVSEIDVAIDAPKKRVRFAESVIAAYEGPEQMRMQVREDHSVGEADGAWEGEGEGGGDTAEDDEEEEMRLVMGFANFSSKRQ